MSFDSVTTQLSEALSAFPRMWDGRTCITEMKDSGSRHWKQMEWIGWYFEHICDEHLVPPLETPGPRYGKSAFDGHGVVPWDFKAHVDKGGADTVIVNDTEAVLAAIAEFGCVGLILARGHAQYDEDGSFKSWHEDLKGAVSAYTKERIRRGARSRRRKKVFRVDTFQILRLDEAVLRNCKSFQAGFRNADGSPRRPKVSLSLRDAKDAVIHSI